MQNTKISNWIKNSPSGSRVLPSFAWRKDGRTKGQTDMTKLIDVFRNFQVLFTQCIFVFCTDLRINGDYFPIQH